MNDSKPWFMSRTIWGALIAVSASVGGAFGIMISEQEQANLTDAILTNAAYLM